MKFLSLWTWLIILSVWKYLPPTHPWKQRKQCFTLREWYEGCTQVSHMFDLCFWAFAVTSPMILKILINNLFT